MFLREGFGDLAPKLVGYSAAVPSGTGMVNPRGTQNPYRDPALMWASVKQSSGKSFATRIDKKKEFQVQVVLICSYRDPHGPDIRGGKCEVILVPQLLVAVKARFFLGVTPPTLLNFKLESREGTMVYNRTGDVTVRL